MLRNERPSAWWCSAFLPLPSLNPGGPCQCLNSGPRSEPGVDEGRGPILDGLSSSHRASRFPTESRLGRFCSRHSPFAPNCKGDTPLYGFARCVRPFVDPSGLPESRPGRQAFPALSRSASIPRWHFCTRITLWGSLSAHSTPHVDLLGIIRDGVRVHRTLEFDWNSELWRKILFSLHT